MKTLRKNIEKEKTAISRSTNKNGIWGKIVLQLRKMISFAPHAYLKYYKLGSVHEGYSELSDMGIILKGKCEPKFSLYKWFKTLKWFCVFQELILFWFK